MAHIQQLTYGISTTTMSSNPDIPLDPSGAETQVIIKMPFTFDVDGLTAELFGEEYELTGTIIDTYLQLSRSAFYAEGANTGWLNYIQGDEEDHFDVYVDQQHADAAINAIKTVTNFTQGQTYDPANSGAQVIDASGVFENASDTWNNYNSVHDFVISWFAWKILGHPGALAAISNDSHLREKYTEFFNEGINAMKGANNCAIEDVSALQSRSIADVSGEIITTGQPTNGMSQADLRLIVQQLMEQAPARFTDADRGVLEPVEWCEGDIIQIQLVMSNNSFAVANTISGTTKTTPDGRARINPNTGDKYFTSVNTGHILNDEYILQLHMGP